MLILSILLFCSSLFILWYFARMVIDGVARLSHKLHLSSFMVSFFVLGFLTSLPELFVGINSVIDKEPEIFIGNLIGGQIVLFLFIIPVLALVAGGIKLTKQLKTSNLLLTLLVVAAPSFLIADSVITQNEGIFLLVLYGFLFYSLRKKRGIVEQTKEAVFEVVDGTWHEVGKIIVGVAFIFLSSIFLVDETVFISHFFGISPFIVSFLILSIGTNLPEFSLALQSVASGRKEIAFGDYLGSAVANTFLFAAMTLFYGAEIAVTDHFPRTLVFMVISLGVFFFFTRSKNDISQKEGLALLMLYVLFIIFELIV